MIEEIAVRAREINILEDTLGMGRRRKRLERLHSIRAEGDDFTRFHIPDIVRLDQIQGAGFRGDHMSAMIFRVLELSQNQRAKAERVPRGNHPIQGQEKQRIGAASAGQSLDDATHERRFSGRGDEMDDDFSVRSGLKNRPGLLEFVSQQGAVDEIAVVRDGNGALGIFDDERLGVFKMALPRRRITIVTDGVGPFQALDNVFLEDVRNQSHLPM